MNFKKEIIYRQIGAKIVYYRTLQHMTQAELAEKIHMSQSSIGRIERGKYNNGISISTLLDIAEGLNINAASLITFSEEEEQLCLAVRKEFK